MNLREQQHQFWEWIVGEAEVRETALLITAGALSPDERVNVYAEMYWLRLRDVLRDEFPQVRAVLGDDDFDILAAKYVRAHPSRHPSLDWLGHALPAFLRSHPVAEVPWLADLAELEWARSQAFIAPDSAVAETSALAALTPETAMQAVFTVTPSVRVLRLGHDVRALFRALRDGEGWRGVTVEASDVALVVFRQGFTVFHDTVSAEEAAALELARDGATLPALCEAFVAFGAEAPARAFQAIGSWVTEGLVASVET